MGQGHGGSGGEGDLDDGVWKLHALQHDGVLLVTQSLSSDDILQPSQSHNVSCPRNLHKQNLALSVDVVNHLMQQGVYRKHKLGDYIRHYSIIRSYSSCCVEVQA